MSVSHCPKQVAEGINKGRWRVGIGYELLKGKRVGKQFWLGKDERTAQRLTAALEAAWCCETTTDPQGKKIWCKENIAKAFAFVPTAPTQSATLIPMTPPPFVSKEGIVTLHQGFDSFIAFKKERLAANDIGETHFADMENTVKALKRLIADLPLAQCDARQLATIRGIITSRPASLNNGEPVSIATVIKWLVFLGMAFDYFNHPLSKIGWQPEEERWRENFNLTAKALTRLQTPAEQLAADEPLPTFTIEELILPYKYALPKQRMFILFGACLGWTQVEIATLRIKEIGYRGGEMYIHKPRSKTGVVVEFWICPELRVLIERFRKSRPSASEEKYNELAFLTENGLPLVHQRTDSIKLSWGLLKHRLHKINPSAVWYPFGRLRKFAGQQVENISGNEYLAQMLLAHKQKSTARKHYVDPNRNLGVGQTQYQRLQAVQATGLDLRVVDLFGRVFFDVKRNEKVCGLDWILSNLFAGFDPHAQAPEPLVWMVMALGGGTAVLELLIRDSQGRPEPQYPNRRQIAQLARLLTREHGAFRCGQRELSSQLMTQCYELVRDRIDVDSVANRLLPVQLGILRMVAKLPSSAGREDASGRSTEENKSVGQATSTSHQNPPGSESHPTASAMGDCRA